MEGAHDIGTIALVAEGSALEPGLGAGEPAGKGKPIVAGRVENAVEDFIDAASHRSVFLSG
jgi:hypothetical protein